MTTRTSLTPRRTLVGGFGLVAGFLVMASVAHACVDFVGDLELTALDAPQAGTQTEDRLRQPISGSGAHAYCPTREPVYTAKVQPGERLQADWDPGTLPCETVIPNGNYDVRTRPVPTYTGADGVLWTMESGSGCFRSTATTWYDDIGDMSVTGGSGTGTYTIPVTGPRTGLTYTADSSTTAHNFCIGGKDSNNQGIGILAPYQII